MLPGKTQLATSRNSHQSGQEIETHFCTTQNEIEIEFHFDTPQNEIEIENQLGTPKMKLKILSNSMKTQSATSRKSKGQIPRSDLTQNPKIKSGPVPPTRIRPRSNPKKC